jgi:Transglutaminase-like superfamily
MACNPHSLLGRYAQSLLSTKCKNLEEIRAFLCGCKIISDKEQFGKEDYWQPPDQFKKTKQGDCDDFAFWTWRQFLNLGYDARVVFGQRGRYGIGHAWVEFCHGGKWFLVEPQFCVIGAVSPGFPPLDSARDFP